MDVSFTLSSKAQTDGSTSFKLMNTRLKTQSWKKIQAASKLARLDGIASDTFSSVVHADITPEVSGKVSTKSRGRRGGVALDS
jgi:hypothetical protein